jgi:outer membrane protein OmpA-like peptidoglycan-associated protein
LPATAQATLLFNRREADLPISAQRRLDGVVAYWRSLGAQGVISVVGHADPGGEKDQAETLSALRSRLVRGYLLAQGVPATQIRDAHEADRAPVIEEGRRNRRVEVKALQR